MFFKYYRVVFNHRAYCVKARSVSDAVFAALRSAEYNGRLDDTIGFIKWESIQKPPHMSFAAFKRMIEGT